MDKHDVHMHIEARTPGYKYVRIQQNKTLNLDLRVAGHELRTNVTFVSSMETMSRSIFIIYQKNFQFYSTTIIKSSLKIVINGKANIVRGIL